MLDILGKAASSVRAHTRGAMVSANNVANAASESYEPAEAVMLSSPDGGVEAQVRPSGESEVDLAKEMQNMESSQRAIEANIAVIRTSDKTLGVLLNVVA
jgi:flagellar hook protein FlgE